MTLPQNNIQMLIGHSDSGKVCEAIELYFLSVILNQQNIINDNKEWKLKLIIEIMQI